MNPAVGFLARETGKYFELRHSITAIALGGFTSLLAGVILGFTNEIFLAIPGLLILLPTSLGMRGNIFATLASRLGSALHMGTLKKMGADDNILTANVLAAFSLSIVLSVYLGFVSKGMTFVFNLPAMPLVQFISISVLAAVISSIFLMATTVWISFYSYKKGWDPDNVTSPIITAVGDFFTTPSLLAAAIFIRRLPDYADILAYMSIAVSLIIVYTVIFPSDSRYRRILMESMPVLAVSGGISGLAGLILESYIHNLVSIPLVLIFLPSFMETTGNLTNILAARVSSKLHLGTMDATLSLTRVKKEELFNSMRIAYPSFPVIGALAALIGGALGIGGLSFVQMLQLSLLSGIVIHFFLLLMAMAVSVYSFRMNIDPDNVTIPIMTSIADVMSVLVLVTMMNILGFV